MGNMTCCMAISDKAQDTAMFEPTEGGVSAAGDGIIGAAMGTAERPLQDAETELEKAVESPEEYEMKK